MWISKKKYQSELYQSNWDGYKRSLNDRRAATQMDDIEKLKKDIKKLKKIIREGN